MDKKEVVRKLNKILPLFGARTIDFDKIGRSQSYVRSKLNEITSNLAKNLFGIPESTDDTEFEKESGREMLLQLKEEFAATDDRHMHAKILSVLPRSWLAREIEKQFNTSFRLALYTKQTVEQHGILCDEEKRMGTKILPASRVQLISIFFLQDDISQPCPGKFDFVTVLRNNEKVKIQKKLLLMNLKEAHCQFKLMYPDEPVGFSTFASLRPKQCILALEKGGTHSTCVCGYHQNVKLVFQTLNKWFNLESYRDIFDKFLCAAKSEKCHLNECKECQGETAVQDFVRRILDFIDTVQYKQWRNNESGKNSVYIHCFLITKRV